MILFTLNTIAWGTPIYVVGIVKTFTPVASWRRAFVRLLVRFCNGWSRCNRAIMRGTRRYEIDVEGIEGLDREQWYLLICNHQSWVDIPIILEVFHNRIPFPKFFLKQELIWIPILGLAWWFLDFPFMKRFSQRYLEKHPEMRGKDLETTRKSCAEYLKYPATVMNFTEGTRFTPEKRTRHKSPHRHLLKARSGGLAFTLSAMGNVFDSMIDVTIYYPDGPPGFWDYLSGNFRRAVVRVERRRVPDEMFVGDYGEDEAFRARVQHWVLGLWEAKDELLDSLQASRR